jgi:hypothetical protein
MHHRFLVLSVVVLAGVVANAACLNLVQPQPKPTAESLCASAANAFYCQTSIVPQDPTLNSYGYNGYCMVGSGSGKIGYSGVTGNGGATPVYPTSDQAWRDGCGANSSYARGICNSVVRCTHE